MPVTEEFDSGLVRVRVVDSAEEMGALSARQAADSLMKAAAAGRETVLWLMAAPSAFPFYSAMLALARSDAGLTSVLGQTHYFQFDDYPLRRGSPQFQATFRHLLEERLFRPLAAVTGPLTRLHLLELTGEVTDSAVAWRYTGDLLALKSQGAFLLQIKGMGMDGHWGFHGAETPLEGEPAMICVPMNAANRHQQCLDWPSLFKSPSDVPDRAFTFNVPMFLQADEIIDNVPQAAKGYAVLACYGTEQVLNELPSSALKIHPRATAFLTRASARTLLEWRAQRLVQPDSELSPEARQRLAALWDDPAAPEQAAQNRSNMDAVLLKVGVIGSSA